MYKVMPKMNSTHIKSVYVKAEELFTKLDSLIEELRPWTAIGDINIEDHIQKHFTEVKDWIDNFEMLRQKRKELKNYPDAVWIDCINVNLVTFKSGVDSIYTKFEDALVDTLEESIERDSFQVRTFI
jgi:dynein heavy chain 2